MKTPINMEKLHTLAQALAKRPRLKVVVQGRYSLEHDGFELKALNVRRPMADQQGVELEVDEDPGPPDYGNPEIQAVLEAIYVQQYGFESLESLRKSLLESGSTEAAAKETETSAQNDKTDDPGLLSKALYAKLELEAM